MSCTRTKHHVSSINSRQPQTRFLLPTPFWYRTITRAGGGSSRQSYSLTISYGRLNTHICYRHIDFSSYSRENYAVKSTIHFEMVMAVLCFSNRSKSLALPYIARHATDRGFNSTVRNRSKWYHIHLAQPASRTYSQRHQWKYVLS